MHPKLFSVFLCTIFCVSFACGSPVESQNVTETSKIVPANIAVPAVTTVSPLIQGPEDLKSKNKTIDAKNETVISNKIAESPNPTEPVIVDPKATITTTNTSTVTNTTNTNKTSTVVPNPVVVYNVKPMAPAAKTVAPTEIISSTPTTVTVSSTETHTVTILPISKIEEKEKDREFDGPSFIGGIVLVIGLTGIGFVAYKFCKSRTDRTYRNF